MKTPLPAGGAAPSHPPPHSRILRGTSALHRARGRSGPAAVQSHRRGPHALRPRRRERRAALAERRADLPRYARRDPRGASDHHVRELPLREGRHRRGNGRGIRRALPCRCESSHPARRLRFEQDAQAPPRGHARSRLPGRDVPSLERVHHPPRQSPESPADSRGGRAGRVRGRHRL